MRFGETPVSEAEGAILVHSLRLGKVALKKGRVLSAADLLEITASGIDEITVVRLEPGDIIASGTMAGVGSLVPGDSVEIDIARVGRMKLAVTSRVAAVR